MIEVSIRELKSRLSHYLRKLDEGEQIKITRRGKIVGTIIPTPVRDGEESSSERAIRRLMAKGIVTWSGRKFVPSEQGVKMRGKGATIAEMILEDRGDRLP